MKNKTADVSGNCDPPLGLERIKISAAIIILLLQLLLNLPGTAYAKNIGTIIKAPVLNQFPELPTGCEATSLTMLLNWAGVNVSKEEVAGSLPIGCIPTAKENRLYGDNPHKAFVGNPFTVNGYGVYHEPIADILNKYLPDSALDLTGASFEEILKAIDSGKPVIVWCTIGNVYPKISKTWQDEQGNIIIWKVPEHAVLLVGYDESHVIVNDPYMGQRCRYPLCSFEEHWEMMGKQAVTIN
ncbi:hypothetical protein OXPF_08990 [Oxobacter pfennigii]|uniref:Peptidase C39-like domain-containing protein n=1 Tax=Oxobacter pfennigii TaxID=36849 RepID=A0A0P8YEP4_9CLOT|nr:C39 family peptidase [Oxobacter pfennigii]KPU45666.1 hypothetical protein OXPF_08990 [Oxobacter pfennigii]